MMEASESDGVLMRATRVGGYDRGHETERLICFQGSRPRHPQAAAEPCITCHQTEHSSVIRPNTAASLAGPRETGPDDGTAAPPGTGYGPDQNLPITSSPLRDPKARNVS